MTRVEYMEKLAKELKAYDEDFAMDIMEDYRRHFDEAASDGRSEESVCEELGSVEDFIKDIPEEFKKSAEGNDCSEASSVDVSADSIVDSSAESSVNNSADSSAESSVNNIGKTEGTYTYSNDTGSSEAESVDTYGDEYSDNTEGTESKATDSNGYEQTQDNDFTDDFGRIAREFGRFVNVAGKVAGRAAKKAVQGADEALSKLGEVINDKLNGRDGSNVDVHFSFSDDEEDDYMDDNASYDYDYNDGVNHQYDGMNSAGNAFMEGVRPISYTGIENLKMELVYASVEIRQGVSQETQLAMSRPLTPKEKLYTNITVSVEDGTLIIKQENKANTPFRINFNEPLTFYVTLPESFEKVKVSTVSGGITITDGSIRVRKYSLTTVSGCIRVAAPVFADKIELSSVSGSIKVDERLSAGTVKLHSVSGSIKGIIFGEDFEADTVSGSIKLGIASACKGKLNTVSGSMNIKLMDDIGLDIKSSAMSGSMKLITDKHVEWNKGEKNTVHFGFNNSSRSAFFGDGGAKLTTSSVSGSVKVYDFGQDE